MEMFRTWKVQSTQINNVGKTVKQAEARVRTHSVRLGIDPNELWDMLLLASIAYVKTFRICGDNAVLVIYRNYLDSIANVTRRETELIQAGNSVRATLRIYTPDSERYISQTVIHYSKYFITPSLAQEQLSRLIAEAEKEMQ